MARTVAVAITLLCLVGCTTLQAVDNTRPESLRQQVHVGDDVRVLAKDGRTYELKVTRLEPDALYGSDGRTTFKVPYQEIVELKVRKFSPLKTFGATLGTAAVLFVVLVVAGEVAFGHAVKKATH